MKKLMRFTTEINTMIGQKTKIFWLFPILIIFYGCPKTEIPLGYDLVFDNQTSDELEVRFFNTGSTIISKSYLLTPTNVKNTAYTVGVYKNEFVVEEFFNSWFGKSQVLRNDTLLIEWRGPAYYGGEENHFYNINAWRVEDDNPFNSMDGIFIFTIYPEDLVQDEPQ